jgi:hypothetical protein
LSTDAGSGSFPLVTAATILAERRDAYGADGADRAGTEAGELHRRQGAESQRELDELFARKNKFKNGAEALQAFRDLFDSDEEMEEFGRWIQQMREEERAHGQVVG